MDYICKKCFHTHRYIPHDERCVGILLFVQTAGTNKASRHSSGVCVKTDEVQYTVIYCVRVQTNVLEYTVLCSLGFRTDEVQYTVLHCACVQTNVLGYTVLCKVCFRTDEEQYTVLYYVCVYGNVLEYTVLCKVCFQTDELQYTVLCLV